MGFRTDQIPALIRDWSEIAAGVLGEHGMDSDRAAKVGFDIVRTICNEYSGQQLYLPVWLASRISERNQAIVRDATAGADIAVLVDRYKLNMTTIYNILRRAERAEIASRQRPLFDAD